MRGKVKHAQISEWSAAPDWFRWETTDTRRDGPLLTAIRDLQHEDAQRGGKISRWTFQGWKGIASPSVRWGIRDLSLIWESSGDVTPYTMTRLPSSRGSAKRIDLQLTVTFSSPQVSFGNSCLKFNTRMKSLPESKRPSVGLWKQTGGSWCGTVGKRTAPRYWRVYDKGIESQTAAKGHKWRLELETKGGVARTLCQTHSSALTQPAFCASYCVQSWQSAGLSWPLGKFGPDVKLVNAPTLPPTPAFRLALWLQQTVRPTIPRLLSVFSVAEVLEMLNLSDVAQPKGTDDAFGK
jgi:hypothetical protein